MNINQSLGILFIYNQLIPQEFRNILTQERQIFGRISIPPDVLRNLRESTAIKYEPSPIRTHPNKENTKKIGKIFLFLFSHRCSIVSRFHLFIVDQIFYHNFLDKILRHLRIIRVRDDSVKNQ